MEKVSSKCKNCGSELWYNPKEGCLTCKYCESNYYLPKKKDNAVLVRQYNAGFHPNQLNQTLNAYKCDTCGNVYYMSSEEKSKKCPNCGNSSCSLVEDSGYCADGIIPFKISKEEASKKLVEYLSKKKSVPKNLKKLASNQKLMGVFVPVWNFSYNVHADYSANTTELKKDYQGVYYGVDRPIFGDEMTRVKSLDELATKNEDDDLLELFDENDYVSIIPYLPEYTYGFRVDSINKDIHDYYFSITEKAEKEFEKEVTRTIVKKYREPRNVQVNAETKDVFFNFTYVPVYVNTFTHRGKIYKTYISGTTGKVAGKTPVSAKHILKKLLNALGAIAIIGLLAYLFL